MSVAAGGLYLKLLDSAGRVYQPTRADGPVSWPLPRRGRPGQWTELAWPVPCQSGWHLFRTLAEALGFFGGFGPRVYLAEPRPDLPVVQAQRYAVAASARLVRRLPWTERAARRFAAGCAQRVLPVVADALPGDPRPREVLTVARRFTSGRASRRELRTADETAQRVLDGLPWPSPEHEAMSAVRSAALPEWWEAAADAHMCALSAVRDTEGATAAAGVEADQVDRLRGMLGLDTGVLAGDRLTPASATPQSAQRAAG